MQPQFITLHNKAQNLTGYRSGSLVAVGPIERNRYGIIVWLCQCDCGNTTSVTISNLKTGKTTSCGCAKRKRNVAVFTKHGMTDTAIYQVWRCMKDRCERPNCTGFKNYGGRGIEVCSAWKTSFENFYEHVRYLPDYGKEGYSLDRIDNDSNYEPGNVRWASRSVQNKNRRANHMITFGDKTQCISDWSRETGVSKRMILHRLRKGWDIENALMTPTHPNTRYLK